MYPTRFDTRIASMHAHKYMQAYVHTHSLDSMTLYVMIFRLADAGYFLVSTAYSHDI